MEPTLRCPSCGNNLAAVDAPTVACPFCRMTVPVPAMFRRPVQVVVAPQNPYAAQSPPPMPMQMQSVQFVGRSRGSSPAIGAIVAVAVLLMAMGMGFALFALRSSGGRSSSQPSPKNAVAEDDPAVAPILTFGGKGTTAGRFD